MSPSSPAAAQPEEPSLTVAEDASPDEAAASLAAALGRVPAVRRYADMPLSDLAARGPRIARRLWEAVPQRLQASLGTRTVGDLLARGDDG
jgi:hypothetical protein